MRIRKCDDNTSLVRYLFPCFLPWMAILADTITCMIKSPGFQVGFNLLLMMCGVKN